jgi:hypothetical protein
VDTMQLLVVVVLIALVAVVAWFAYQRQRSNRLKERFGSEYERTVGDVGDRRKAEAELQARASRVEQLNIRPLDPAERDRFDAAWRTAQARFVDEPEAAVGDADRLVGEVMEARGYPVDDFEQRAANVSVDHGNVVEHYRAAHDIAERQRGNGADTEELRQAMVHYRALFADLLETPQAEGADGGSATRDMTASGRQG